jgi:hypothetical protein
MDSSIAQHGRRKALDSIRKAIRREVFAATKRSDGLSAPCETVRTPPARAEGVNLKETSASSRLGHTRCRSVGPLLRASTRPLRLKAHSLNQGISDARESARLADGIDALPGRGDPETVRVVVHVERWWFCTQHASPDCSVML